MKYSKSAIGLLTREYRSVLKKCLLINLGLFALGAIATPANAITASAILGSGGLTDGVDLATVSQYASGTIAGADIGIYGKLATPQTNSYTAENIDIGSNQYGVLLYKGVNFNLGGDNTSQIAVSGSDLGLTTYYGAQVNVGNENTDINISGGRAVYAYEKTNAENFGDKGAKISIVGKTIDITGGEYGVIALNQTHAQYAPSIDITGKTVNVKATTGNAVHVGNGSTDATTELAEVNIKADEINLSATNGSAISAMSQGKVNIEGNTTIVGQDAILTRGNAETNINASGEHTVKMTGDINFNYNTPSSNSPIDAVVNVNLTNDESFWEGNTLVSWNQKPTDAQIADDVLKVTNATVNLSNGAIWKATKVSKEDVTSDGGYYQVLNNLNVDGGKVNKAEDGAQLQVDNLKVGAAGIIVGKESGVTEDAVLTANKSADFRNGVADDHSSDINVANDASIYVDADSAGNLIDDVAGDKSQIKLEGIQLASANVTGGKINTAGYKVTSNATNSLKAYYQTVEAGTGGDAGKLILGEKQAYTDLIGILQNGNYIKAYDAANADTTSVAANLKALDNQVFANAGDIATNAGDIATNAENIAANTANISTNTANIATNTANIATNAENIAANTTAIAGKQDALTAGSNITISTDAESGKLTISATDTNTTYTTGNGIAIEGTDNAISVKTGNGVMIDTNGKVALNKVATNSGLDYDTNGAVKVAGIEAANLGETLAATISGKLTGAKVAYDAEDKTGDKFYTASTIDSNFATTAAMNTALGTKLDTATFNGYLVGGDGDDKNDIKGSTLQAASVTRAKLAADVTGSLDLADSSIQSVSIDTTNADYLSASTSESGAVTITTAKIAKTNLATDLSNEITASTNKLAGDWKIGDTSYTTAQTYIDAADTNTLNSAKSYTDSFLEDNEPGATDPKLSVTQSIAKALTPYETAATAEGKYFAKTNIEVLEGAASGNDKVYSVAATDAKIAASADTKANVALDNLSDAGQAVIDTRADSRIDTLVGHAAKEATETTEAVAATGLFAKVDANTANITANRNMFEDKEGVLGGKLTVAESIQARINNGNGTVDADTKVYSTDVTDNLISTAVTNATTEITNGVTEAWTKAYNWSKYILGVEPKDLRETQLQTALNKLGASEEEGGDGKGNNIEATNFAGALHELDVEKLAKSSAQEGATLELENADGYFTATGEKGDATSGYLFNQLTVNSNEEGIVLTATDNRQGEVGKTSELEVKADGVFYRNGTQSSKLDEVATLGTAKDGIYSGSGDTAVTIEEAIAANTALFENDEEEGTKLSVTQSIAKALSGKQDITAKDVAAQSLKVSIPATETAAENVIFEAKAGENGNTIALNGKTTVKGGLVTDSLNFGGKNTVDKITTKMINSENKGTNVLATAAAVYKAIGHVDGLVTADDQGVRTFNGTEAEGLVSTNLAGEEGAQHYYGNLATGTDVARDLVSLDNAVGNLNFKASDATGEGVIATNYLNGVTTVSGALSKLDTQAKANADAIAQEVTDRETAVANAITEAKGYTDTKVNELAGKVYSKEATNSAISSAVNELAGKVYAKDQVYTKTETDTAISTSVNELAGKVYSKEATNSAISSAVNELAGKVYAKDQVYTKTETEGKIKTTAANADYDNTTSGLQATTIAGAIDEVEGRVDSAESAIGTINDNITVAAPAEGEAYNYIEAGTDVADNLVALDKGIATAQKAAQDYAVAYTNAYAANAKYDADADYAEDSIGGAIQANTKAIDALEDATTISANGHYYTTEDTVASAVSKVDSNLARVENYVGKTTGYLNDQIAKTNKSLGEEIGARKAADTALQNNIDAEAQRAKDAEAALQSDIDKRKVTIENGIASITDGTTTAEVYTKAAAEAIFYEKQQWVDETLGISSADADAVKNAYAGTNYLKDATTLTDADKILDSTIKTVDDKFTNGTVDAKFASVTTTGDANIGGDLNVKGGIKAENGKFEVYGNGYVKAAGGKFTVTENGYMTAAAGKFKVGQGGSISATNGKFEVFDSGYIKAADGKFTVGENGYMTAAAGKFSVGEGGSITTNGDLNVAGTSNLKDTNVDGKLTVTNGAEITGKTVVKGEFGAGATGTEFQVNTAGVAYAQGLNVNDAFQVGSTGNVYVGIDKFTVDAANGNVTTKGTVNINGATLTGSDEALTSDKKIVSANGFEVNENNSLTTDGLKASAADIAGNAKVGGDLEVKGGISATNGLFTVHDNGYVDAAGGKFKVGQGGSISATNGKFTVHDNGYVDAAGGKFTVGENGYMTASNGKFTVGENGYMTAANGKFSVGENGSISASNGNFIADKAGNVTAAGNLSAAGGNFTVVTTTDETDQDNPKTTTNMTLVGNETINGNLGVTGTAWLTNAQVSQNLNVQGDAKVGALVIDEEFATSIDNGTTAVEGEGSSHALATTATVMTSAENAKYTNNGTGVVKAKNVATLHDAIQVLDNAMGTMALNTQNKNLVDDSGATLTNATDALNALDGVVGNVKDLNVSKGNLHATKKDVASHLSALDARLGTIKAINGGGKGNLAIADSDVATHFGS